MDPDFARTAEAVFRRIRDAMTRVIEGLPEGGSIGRAVHLQKALDVDTSLAWRVFKIAGLDNPLDVVDYFPTSGQIDTLADALKKKGVPAAMIEEVRQAAAGYDELLREHATSRESLLMMVGSLRPERGDLIDEKCRKSAFQQSSLVWGRQSEVLLNCGIYQPAANPGEVTGTCIIGVVGFHQLRPDKEPRLRLEASGSYAQPMAEADPSTLVPSGEVLREFCSPGFDTHATEDDRRRLKVRVKLPGLGRRSSVDYFQLITSNTTIEQVFLTRLRSTIIHPTAMLYQDLLLPAIDMSRSVRSVVYERLENDVDIEQMGPSDVMPINLSPTFLGTLTDAPPILGVPRYTEMIRSVLERMGWYGRKFDVYRCRLPYPILSTTVNMVAEPQMG